MVLSRSGEVRAYDHFNERRYVLDGAELRLLSEKGDVTSRLKWSAEANAFLPFDNARHYLLPLFALDAPVASPRRARIIVNTVPKAGTYLIAEALQRLGYRSLDIHLNSGGLHDNRGVPSSEIHYDPHSRFVPCPPRAIAELMAPGEFAVAHIQVPEELRAVQEAGVKVISAIRDLRGVAVSNFRFRRDKVKPVCHADHLLNKLDTRTAFMAYLVRASDEELPGYAHFTRMMLAESRCLLRFEDLVEGRLTGAARAELNAIEPGLAKDFAQALPKAIGQPTSTFSGRRSVVDEFNSPEIDEVFEITGCLEANRKAGYEPRRRILGIPIS